jgi:hypothetical protein
VPTRREVIRFDAEPIKIKLDKGPYAAVECRGQYGIDWRYSVNNGTAVMYLPAEGREALLQCGAGTGDEVAIRKVSKGLWEAEWISNEPASPPQPETRPEDETDEPRPRRSKPRRLPERLFAEPELQAAPEPQPPSPPVPITSAAMTTLQRMMSCYYVAVDVALEVQEYARKKGINIAFTGSDIRAMGITVFIGDNQRLREVS